MLNLSNAKKKAERVYSRLFYTMKKRCCCAIFLAFALDLSFPVNAADSRDTDPTNGLNVSLELEHEVEIPQILFFRIGSISAVEQVTFDLLQTQVLQADNSTYSGAALALGDGNPISASSNGDLDVYLVSNIAPVDISYTVSNPNGLSNGLGDFIAFDQIITQSSDAGLPAPRLDNAGAAAGSANAVNILGNFFGGLVADYRNVTWTYQYANDQVPVAGNYTGRITYTASVP